MSCRHTRCRHFGPTDDILDGSEQRLYEDPPDAGIWHVHHLHDAHHVSIVPLWLGTPDQKAFWRDLGHWLRAIDCVRRRDAPEARAEHRVVSL